MDDIKPLQRLEVQVPSSSTHTIDLTNSDQEEEVSSVPITKEAGDHLQDFIDLLNGKAKKDSIPIPEIQKPPSVSEPSTVVLLLTSIQTLSTFPAGVPPPPSLSQLYHTVTTIISPISSCPFQNPMPQYNTEE